MSDLNRRNTESVFQSLQNMDIMIRETKIMMDATNQAVASLNNRVLELENALAIVRIRLMGNGPTQK